VRSFYVTDCLREMPFIEFKVEKMYMQTNIKILEFTTLPKEIILEKEALPYRKEIEERFP